MKNELHQQVQEAIAESKAAAEAEAQRIADAVAATKAKCAQDNATVAAATLARQAATLDALRARTAAVIEAETRGAYIAAGGTAAEFARDWPDMKARIIAARAMAALAEPRRRTSVGF